MKTMLVGLLWCGVLLFLAVPSVQASQDPDDPNIQYPLLFFEFNELGNETYDVTIDLGDLPPADATLGAFPGTYGTVDPENLPSRIVDDAGGNGKAASRTYEQTIPYDVSVRAEISDPDSKLPESSSQITLAGWYQISESVTYIGQIFGSDDTELSFNNGSVHVSNFPQWYTGNPETEIVDPDTTNDSQWHHACFTYDGNDAKLYVDGQLKYTRNAPGKTLDFSSTWRIGSVGGPYYQCQNMRTDECLAYDVALTAAQVTDLYENGPKLLQAHEHDPFHDQIILPQEAPTTLNWTNSTRATASAAVWFGTDPNSSGTMLGDNALLNTSATIPEALSAGNTYYWQVNETEPNQITGRMVSFLVTAIPTADAGDDQEVYLVEPGTVDVALDGSGSGSALTYQWSVEPGPGEVTFDDDKSATPTATMTVAGVYVLKLVITNDPLSDEDEVTITVYEDSCAFAEAQPGFVWYDADINLDCIVDLLDFQMLSSEFLSCNDAVCP